MDMKRRLAAALLGFSSLVAGCGDGATFDPGSSPRAVLYTITYTAGWGCRDCDFKNSPWLGAFPMPVLGYAESAAEDVPRIIAAIEPSGDAWPVSLVDGALVVTTASGTVEAGGLEGWTLSVKMPDGTLFAVEIYAYKDVEDWTDAHDTIPTYGLSTYDAVSDSNVNLCPGQDLDETSIVFLQGEAYDLSVAGVGGVTTISESATLGCRGHALAKMKLLGHDPASPYQTTSAAERVATLRMVTADYCGTGHSYTQFGTAVDWTDTAGQVQYDAATMGTELEAEWDETGATCFMTPRVPGTTPECGQASPPIPKCDSEEYSSPSAGTIWTSILP